VADRRVVLASSSPRRSDLLTQIGIAFTVVPADIDEREQVGEDPVAYVCRLAVGKAGVGEFADADIVIAADTTVDVDGQILAKPEDEADARRMLTLLSGRTHDVHTGVAVRHRGRTEIEVATTRVSMVVLDAATVDWYLATGEPFGKAGAYALQGAASALVERVEGSVSNVIGLPLAVLDTVLRRFGETLVALSTTP
jgi:septum formation protein